MRRARATGGVAQLSGAPHRLDDPNAKVSPGFNFRYANYWADNNSTTAHRQLYKAFGIRFIILIQGTAGRFSIVPLLITLGSGVALLSLATLTCDFVTMNCLRRREFYRQRKYEYASEEAPGVPADSADFGAAAPCACARLRLHCAGPLTARLLHRLS